MLFTRRSSVVCLSWSKTSYPESALLLLPQRLNHEPPPTKTATAPYEALNPLWDAYNFAFRIIIDEYENEELPAKHIGTALAMAQTALAKCDDDTERNGLGTLIKALQLAQEHHTFLELVF